MCKNGEFDNFLKLLMFTAVAFLVVFAVLKRIFLLVCQSEVERSITTSSHESRFHFRFAGPPPSREASPSTSAPEDSTPAKDSEPPVRVSLTRPKTTMTTTTKRPTRRSPTRIWPFCPKKSSASCSKFHAKIKTDDDDSAV